MYQGLSLARCHGNHSETRLRFLLKLTLFCGSHSYTALRLSVSVKAVGGDVRTEISSKIIEHKYSVESLNMGSFKNRREIKCLF